MGRKKSKNTFHSYDRAAERAGLSRSEAKRLMKVASGHRQALELLPEGPIKHYLLGKSAGGKRIKYVEGYVFVLSKNSTKCLTMYPIKDEVVKAQQMFEEGYFWAYCPKCKHYFVYETVEQMPGFRDTEDLNCPCCGYTVEQSMEWYYYPHKID